jgi:hypothetical protein
MLEIYYVAARVIGNHRRRAERVAAEAVVAHGSASQRAGSGTSNRRPMTHKRSALTEGNAGPIRETSNSRGRPRPRAVPGC